MTTSISKFKSDLVKAEERVYKVQATRESALAAVHDKYDKQLIDAKEEAVKAQKLLCDAEAVSGLADRDDAEAVAASLNLEL
jgi:hypothetical protein